MYCLSIPVTCVPPDANVCDLLVCLQDGRTCLFSACCNGYLDVAKYLVEQGGKQLITIEQEEVRELA